MPSQSSSDTAVVEKQKAATKPQRPPRFKVVLLNDDFTPFEFVIEVMQDIFQKTQDQAEALAALIHQDGKGACGVFIKDIAELKRDKVMRAAHAEQHPLQCVLEPEAPEPGGKGMKP